MRANVERRRACPEAGRHASELHLGQSAERFDPRGSHGLDGVPIHAGVQQCGAVRPGATDWHTRHPDLAKNWVWDATWTKVTFQLEEGVRWHDGEPFTAADVHGFYLFEEFYQLPAWNGLTRLKRVRNNRRDKRPCAPGQGARQVFSNRAMSPTRSDLSTPLKNDSLSKSTGSPASVTALRTTRCCSRSKAFCNRSAQ
jgi:hypothetical protein